MSLHISADSAMSRGPGLRRTSSAAAGPRPPPRGKNLPRPGVPIRLQGAGANGAFPGGGSPVNMERRAIAVHGTVQGVGFRPFVYALASRLDLGGFVRNDLGSVWIEVEGQPGSLDQ